MRKIKVAIAGNPNCGKTTLFNELAGTHYQVANYPGVTVEQKLSTFIYENHEITIVDLPGTYSLSAYSLEEVVARDFIINEKPDLILHVVDASNIERNLYLTTQFIELGLPILLALNMMDVALQRGMKIDHTLLSKNLSLPVVPIVARKGEGKHELLEAIITHKLVCPIEQSKMISYGQDLDDAIKALVKNLETNPVINDYQPSWIALKYLERDEQILKKVELLSQELHQKQLLVVDSLEAHLNSTLSIYPEALISDYRYGHVASVLRGVVERETAQIDRVFLSDKIDRFVTGKYLGPLLMLIILYSTYQFTFFASELPIAWTESFFGFLSSLAERFLTDPLFKSLIVDGVIGGVGGVLGFAPLIFFMFIAIALLEDSGYMARIAYMLDKVFRLFGLHGTSVLPYVVSGGIAGGCAVPGIMATRTIKGRKERLLTILTAPFMSCGAKLPVFALLISVFFPAKDKGLILLLITLFSWLVALIIAKLFSIFVVKGESTSFIMELPPYRFPTAKGLLIHAFDRTSMYVKKAFTVILAASVVMWLLMTFPRLPSGESSLENSYAGRIGVALESVTKFAGFDWKSNIALIAGVAAKEIVVSTLGTAYSINDDVDVEDPKSLIEKLRASESFPFATGLALMIFTVIYAPCIVTLTVIAKESGSIKWAIFSLIVNTMIGFFAAVFVFQIFSLL